MTAISASIYSNKKNKRDTTETLGESPWLPQWEDKSYNPNLDDIQVIERTYTHWDWSCLLYTSPSPRDATLSRMPSSA